MDASEVTEVSISHATTADFSAYRFTVPSPWRLLALLGRRVTLEGVLEADEATGLVVRQERNERGEPLYTNGDEDVALTDAVKVLLLIPELRRAFAAEFRPKTTTVYLRGLRVTYNHLRPPAPTAPAGEVAAPLDSRASDEPGAIPPPRTESAVVSGLY